MCDNYDTRKCEVHLITATTITTHHNASKDSSNSAFLFYKKKKYKKHQRKLHRGSPAISVARSSQVAQVTETGVCHRISAIIVHAWVEPIESVTFNTRTTATDRIGIIPRRIIINLETMGSRMARKH